MAENQAQIQTAQTEEVVEQDVQTGFGSMQGNSIASDAGAAISGTEGEGSNNSTFNILKNYSSQWQELMTEENDSLEEENEEFSQSRSGFQVEGSLGIQNNDDIIGNGIHEVGQRYEVTEFVRLTDNPNYWDNPKHYSILPKGAIVEIIDLGITESFNRDVKDPWVKIKTLLLPLRKYEGGMKAAFERLDSGWVISGYLELHGSRNNIPVDKRLPVAPNALSGVVSTHEAMEGISAMANMERDIKQGKSSGKGYDTFKEIFDKLPKYDYELWSGVFEVGDWEVIPHVTDIDGEPHAVFYQLVYKETGVSKWFVGPDSIVDFLSDPEDLMGQFDEADRTLPDLETASNPLEGIVPYSSGYADDFPKYNYALPSEDFAAPPYWLTPWVKNEGGVDKVVAYVAVDPNLQRAEWLIGPDSIEGFMENTQMFVDLRRDYLDQFGTYEDQMNSLNEVIFWAEFERIQKEKEQAEADKHWMAQSEKAVEAAFNGDWDSAFDHLGESWVGEKGALKSPDWYGYAAGFIIGGGGKGPKNRPKFEVPDEMIKVEGRTMKNVTTSTTKNAGSSIKNTKVTTKSGGSGGTKSTSGGGKTGGGTKKTTGGGKTNKSLKKSEFKQKTQDAWKDVRTHFSGQLSSNPFADPKFITKLVRATFYSVRYAGMKFSDFLIHCKQVFKDKIDFTDSVQLDRLKKFYNTLADGVKNGLDESQITKKVLIEFGEKFLTRVSNIGEFFAKTKLGKGLKDISQKTSKTYQGQKIYKIIDKNEFGLNKGDHYYLDALHKDHIEVFDSFGNFKKVLNLDGTMNTQKTAAGSGRTINLK